MYFRPFSFKRGLFFPWQKPGFLGLPQLRKARPFRFREPRGGTREAMGGTATFMKFRIGNRPSFQKLSKTHIFQKTPRVFSHSKSFFFLGKRRQFACFKNSKDEKLDTGAMVQWLVKNSTRKTCHNFEDCNRKSRCEMDLETNSFVFSLSRFAPWPWTTRRITLKKRVKEKEQPTAMGLGSGEIL